MRFELGHELFLDVHHASANLAHRVMVVAARQLVMRRTITEVRRVHRTRGGERLEGSIDGAPRKCRLRPLQLDRDLFGRAVSAEAHDRVVDHLPLRGAPHPWREHQVLMTRKDRSAWVSTRHPDGSTTTSSSIRTPPKPGM